jgi:hypothetical protein
MRKTSLIFIMVIIAALLVTFSSCEGVGNTGGDSTEEDTTSPGEVKEISTSISDKQVTLSWTDPNIDDFDHIEITWEPNGSTTQTVDPQVETYTASGLTNDTTYTFTLKAVDKAGNKSGGVTVSDTPYDLSISGDIFDYYDKTPGRLLTYDYQCSSGYYNSGTRWVTFLENTETEGFSYSYTAPSGTPDTKGFWSIGYASDGFPSTNSSANTVAGGSIHGDVGYYALLIGAPRTISAGAGHQFNGVDFTIVGGCSYEGYTDCIKVSFDSTNIGYPNDGLKGTGHFYLAKNVGVVGFYFEHSVSGTWGNVGDTETYTIKETPETVSKYTISGTVVDIDTSDPLQDIYVLPANDFSNHPHYGVTDASGNFSFDMYYKEGITVWIMAGKDTDSDSSLDSSPTPQDFTIYNISAGNYSMGTLQFDPNL